MKVVRTKVDGKFNYFQVIDIDDSDGYTEADRNLLFKMFQDVAYDFKMKHNKFKTQVW
jgi:hypothetical protein